MRHCTAIPKETSTLTELAVLVSANTAALLTAVRTLFCLHSLENIFKINLNKLICCILNKHHSLIIKIQIKYSLQ